jgi:hypothetical protein
MKKEKLTGEKLAKAAVNIFCIHDNNSTNYIFVVGKENAINFAKARRSEGHPPVFVKTTKTTSWNGVMHPENFVYCAL